MEKLGFTVVGPVETKKRYWALCANPTYYNIDEAVHVLAEDWWTVKRSDVRAGDEVAVWRATGKDRRRGVVALGVVLKDPEVRPDTSNPFWLASKRGEAAERRVPIRYAVPKGLPIWANQEGGAFLHDFAVCKATGGSIFSITDAQWDTLTKCARARATSVQEDLLISGVVRPRQESAAQSGQGFGLDMQQRKAVECRAVEVAIRHYKLKWSIVEDVSSSSSCDLVCKNDVSRLFVEVKGTTSAGCSIMLTRNEVALAERFHPDTALFVVRDIVLRRDANGWIAEGGCHHEISPWKPNAAMLVPISYQYWLNEPPQAERAFRQPSEGL